MQFNNLSRRMSDQAPDQDDDDPPPAGHNPLVAQKWLWPPGPSRLSRSVPDDNWWWLTLKRRGGEAPPGDSLRCWNLGPGSTLKTLGSGTASWVRCMASSGVSAGNLDVGNPGPLSARFRDHDSDLTRSDRRASPHCTADRRAGHQQKHRGTLVCCGCFQVMRRAANTSCTNARTYYVRSSSSSTEKYRRILDRIRDKDGNVELSPSHTMHQDMYPVRSRCLTPCSCTTFVLPIVILCS